MIKKATTMIMILLLGTVLCSAGGFVSHLTRAEQAKELETFSASLPWNFDEPQPSGMNDVKIAPIPNVTKPKLLDDVTILKLCNDVRYVVDQTDCSIRGAFFEYALERNGIHTVFCTRHLDNNPVGEYHLYLRVYRGNKYYYINPSQPYPNMMITRFSRDWHEYDTPWYTDETVDQMLRDDDKHGLGQNQSEYDWQAYPEMERVNETMNRLMR
jgi:hypothetical protein